MSNAPARDHDLVIVGAGISGAAQYYAAAKYSSIGRVLLLEKEPEAGMVNSFAKSNSQTLHEGDIETNYNYEKARKVKAKAAFTRAFVESKGDETLALKGPKMLLGVGDAEYEKVAARIEEFRDLFLTIERLEGDALRAREPHIFKGRTPHTKLIALYNRDGLTINYGELARRLIVDAQDAFAADSERNGEVRFGTAVRDITEGEDGHVLMLADGTHVRSRYISFCSGAHSMYFAKKLGVPETKNVSLICIAGNFYYTPRYVNAKIYTVQHPKLPFSAVHADPDILHKDKNRYGPTTRIVFMLERYRWGTIGQYVRTLAPLFPSLGAYLRILMDKAFLIYAIRHNLLLTLPFIGTYLYLQDVRKIVPTVRYSELSRARGQGGVRPQIVRTDKDNPLDLGEAKFKKPGVRFNVTPSPGASTALYNGLVDVRQIAKELAYSFHTSRVEEDFGLPLKDM